MGNGRSLLNCSVNFEVAVFCESCVADFTNIAENMNDGRLKMPDDSGLAEAVMMYFWVRGRIYWLKKISFVRNENLVSVSKLYFEKSRVSIRLCLVNEYEFW